MNLIAVFFGLLFLTILIVFIIKLTQKQSSVFKKPDTTVTNNNMIKYTKVGDCYHYVLPTTKHYRLEWNPYFINSVKNKLNIVFKPLNLKQDEASSVLTTSSPFDGMLYILPNGGLRFITSITLDDQQPKDQYNKTSSSNMIKFNEWNTLSITSDGKFYVNNVLAFDLNVNIVIQLISNYYPLQSITVCKL
jgi:hypothetical protein